MDYALQIARGLAAAHGKQIVHRDLKPENLFITRDGRVKILDFGLAKLRPKPSATLDTSEPTETLKTDTGIVMGTAGYMSPEQVRGEETDHRSDLFSFGAILYEMLSGQRAFQGKSAVETMGAILKEEPPELSKTNPNIPTALEHIARRCIEKAPEQRFQAASDLAFDLEELLGSSSSLAPVVGQQGRGERLAWAVAIFLFLVVLALAGLHFRRAPTEVGVMRFIIPPPPKTTFAPESTVALSPDGRHLAFAATSEVKTLLWVRSLDSLSSRALPGTEGARGSPFWSPDGRSIGFFAQHKLKRIEAAGGPALSLCNVPGGFGVGTWSHSGVIIFSLSAWSYDVLYRVSDSGGQATPVTMLDSSRQEDVHFWPQFLPDGRHFLYQAAGSGQGGTIVASLDSKETKRVLTGYSNVTYAAQGYLLFVREGFLHAQPFDTRRLETTGDPIPVPEQLQYKKGLGGASLSVSQNGALAYESGNPNSQLIWFDRGGKQLGAIGEAGEYMHVELSPDGKNLAMEIRDRQTKSNDIWLFDLLGGIPTRFTFDPGASFQPAWSPDGSQIAYALSQGRAGQIQKKRSNGTGNPEMLIKGEVAVSDWSWDGRYIAYEYYPAKSADLWILPLFGDHKPFPFLQTEFEEVSGRFSPNGRWMAYTSNQTGREEVYVQSFPPSGDKWLVSTNGGRWPRWRRDGKELFYLASDQKLMAVAVDGGGAFHATVPKVLFQTREITGRYPYTVTPDGQRFLVNTPLEEASTSPITVVLNWTAELKR
jgi:Tol biopolymer transport system component